MQGAAGLWEAGRSHTSYWLQGLTDRLCLSLQKNLIEKYTRLTTLKLKFTRQFFFVFYPILYKHARILFLCHSTSKHLGVVASFTGLSRIPDFPKKGPIWEFGKTVAKGLYQSINKLDVFYGRLMAQ